MTHVANKTDSTGAANSERGSARVDFCRTESGPRVGAQTEGLRAVEKESKGQRPKTKDRSEDSYIIAAFAKGLKIFECFEGRNFEPVTVKMAMERTGYPRSYCRAALITLKKLGFAKEILSGRESTYVLGHKFENLARSYASTELARR